mmetsp:Transcript_32924/g.104097  ORF Transcript_32924/g.104097 Transcript_32924/m.104097 type:complete len:110 (+) Transcript_32924:159-488(+)
MKPLERGLLVPEAEHPMRLLESFCLGPEFEGVRIGSGVIKMVDKGAKVLSSAVRRRAQKVGFVCSGMLVVGMGIDGVQKRHTMCSQFTAMPWPMRCNRKMLKALNKSYV